MDGISKLLPYECISVVDCIDTESWIVFENAKWWANVIAKPAVATSSNKYVSIYHLTVPKRQ